MKSDEEENPDISFRMEGFEMKNPPHPGFSVRVDCLEPHCHVGMFAGGGKPRLPLDLLGIFVLVAGRISFSGTSSWRAARFGLRLASWLVIKLA